MFPLSVYRADLAQIVESVFQTMMNLEVTRAEIPWAPATDVITGAVHFAGEWKGAVLLECTKPQAFEFAHRLMSIETPTEINDDIRDTMGELTNMLAGNLKSVLPRGIGLSMPLVVEGRDYSLRVCGSSVIDRMPFSSDLGVLWVTLVEVLEQA
ncbi:MAG: chemotaxis protein CheX [Acidobacteriia bacterium]|nr:chemotaxis protein CheX [Terriglobia bacterium]